MGPSSGNWSARDLPSYLAGLLLRTTRDRRVAWVLAGLLPLCVFAAVMLLLFTRQQQRTIEGSLREAAAGAAHVVDRAVAEQCGVLMGLATSRALDGNDLATFRLDAQRAWDQHPEWVNLIVTDERRQILNLRLRARDPLPPVRDPDSLARVWATQQASVGVLANGSVACRVPVVRDGRLQYTIAAPIMPGFFRDAIRGFPWLPSWTAALVGADGVVIAALRESFVKEGVPLPDGVRQLEPGKLLRVEARYAVSADVRERGWRVIAFAPASAVEQPFVWMRITAYLGGLLGAGLTAVLVLALSAAWATEREASALRAAMVERSRVAAALRESEQRLHLALEAARAGTWEWDLRTNENVWSEGLWALYGLDPGCCAPSYEAWRQSIHPEDRALTEQAVHNASRQGTVLRAEWRVCLPGGRERWLMSRGQPVRDSDEHVVAYRGIVVDITERKTVEAIVRAREAQLRLFVDHAPAAIAMLDTEMRYLMTSQRWLVDYGLTGQSLLGRNHYEVFSEIPERWKAVHARCLAGAVEQADEDPFVRADGSTQWLRWEIRPWHAAPDTIGGILIFSEDITARKQAEDALRASLEEKVVLLKEVHHRVKNNLQIVASLLNLRAGQPCSREVQEVLRDTRDRVHAMALLHETLYRSGNLARIDVAAYIAELCRHLQRSVGSADGRVAVGTQVAPLTLPLEQAVPCGLIVNELVSNALKHGFPEGRRGTVRVSVCADEEQGLLLQVSDDGVGLSPGFEATQASTLGLRLIANLAGQLRGRFMVEDRPGPGATFRVVFAAAAPERSEERA